MIEIQIGKNGMTEGILTRLKNDFRTHEIVKVKVLKSAVRDKAKIQEISDKILAELGNKYTCRIIGFTLIIRKWRKEKR